MRARLFPRASRLGVGCASLGSRVGRARGLEGLETAFALGVNWFDVAPSYGDGQAETILGAFIRGRRDSIHICTKCGIEPGTVGLAHRVLLPLARSLVTAVPALRAHVASLRPAAKQTLVSADQIRMSIDRSLTRLGTGNVDVFALHDPSLAAFDDDDVLRALEDVVSSGKARVIGVAGSADAARRALEVGLPFRFVQFAAPQFSPEPKELGTANCADDRSMIAVHSILSGEDRTGRLVDLAGSRERLRQILQSAGYAMPFDEAVCAFLLDDALDRNRDGVVLMSMLSGDHARRNAARLSVGPDRARAVRSALVREVAAP